MIICVCEINDRRHLVGLFEDFDNMLTNLKEGELREFNVEELKEWQPEYHATRCWHLTPVDRDEAPVARPWVPYDGWPFGYHSIEHGVHAYEVKKAPNIALEWDED